MSGLPQSGRFTTPGAADPTGSSEITSGLEEVHSMGVPALPFCGRYKFPSAVSGTTRSSASAVTSSAVSAGTLTVNGLVADAATPRTCALASSVTCAPASPMDGRFTSPGELITSGFEEVQLLPRNENSSI